MGSCDSVLASVFPGTRLGHWSPSTLSPTPSRLVSPVAPTLVRTYYFGFCVKLNSGLKFIFIKLIQSFRTDVTVRSISTEGSLCTPLWPSEPAPQLSISALLTLVQTSSLAARHLRAHLSTSGSAPPCGILDSPFLSVWSQLCTGLS